MTGFRTENPRWIYSFSKQNCIFLALSRHIRLYFCFFSIINTQSLNRSICLWIGLATCRIIDNKVEKKLLPHIRVVRSCIWMTAAALQRIPYAIWNDEYKYLYGQDLCSWYSRIRNKPIWLLLIKYSMEMIFKHWKLNILWQYGVPSENSRAEIIFEIQIVYLLSAILRWLAVDYTAELSV